MKHIQELMLLLQKHFNLNHWTLECLSLAMIALYNKRTVNLASLSIGMTGEASNNSRYRRLQRLMMRLPLNFKGLYNFSSSLFDFPTTVYLSMDRTNWKFGKVHINFLVVAIVYKGIGVPLVWSLLPERKRGNSTSGDRIKLFDKLFSFFPVERIQAVLCDREFIDGDWVAYLNSKQIPFVIRAKKNLKASGKSLSHRFRDLKSGEMKVLSDSYCIVGCDLYLSGLRLPSGELLIVLSRSYNNHALEEYALRWEIECFFSAIKKRGFDLEATHMTNEDKLSRLMLVVAITFMWAYRCGELMAEINPIKIKKHGFKAKSLVRLGLDLIGDAISNLAIKPTQILKLIRVAFEQGLSLRKRKFLLGVV